LYFFQQRQMLQDTSESLAQAAQDKVLDDAPPIISPSGERESQGKSKGRPETDAAAAVGGRSELEADAAELIALSSSVLSSLRDVRQRRREGDVIFSKDELQVIWLLQCESLRMDSDLLNVKFPGF
jgi:hypothetical protein